MDAGICRLRRDGDRRAARSDLGALVDLHHLLIERGFRRSCLDDPTIVQEERDEKPADTGAAIRSAPAQHAVRFRRASGISPSDRRTALTRLTRLLLEAAGVATRSVTMTSADLLPAAVLEAQGGGLCSAVHPGPGSEQSREPTTAVRARRHRTAPRFQRRRGDRRRPRPLRQRDGGAAGFERLVAWLCAGEVAPCCASTPPGSPATAATGITCWNCDLVEARVIDLDGVYDPCRPNDRPEHQRSGSTSRVAA